MYIFISFYDEKNVLISERIRCRFHQGLETFLGRPSPVPDHLYSYADEYTSTKIKGWTPLIKPSCARGLDNFFSLLFNTYTIL